MAFGIGGSKGGSESSSSFDQNVFGADQFGDMFSNFNDLWAQMQPFMMGGFDRAPAAEAVAGEAAGAGAAGSNFMLEGGAYGDTTDARRKLMDMMGGRSNMGTIYESIIGGPGNTYIDPLVQSMKDSSFENLDRMKNYGAATAAGMGQGGSSRHAMVDTMMNRRANQDMLGRENAMRASTYDTDLDRKMDIARMADSNRQLEQDRLMQMLSGANESVGTGMDFQPTQQDLGMGMMAPFMQALMIPWMAAGGYSNAFGDPTVLSSGESTSSSDQVSGGFGL